MLEESLSVQAGWRSAALETLFEAAVPLDAGEERRAEPEPVLERTKRPSGQAPVLPQDRGTSIVLS